MPAFFGRTHREPEFNSPSVEYSDRYEPFDVSGLEAQDLRAEVQDVVATFRQLCDSLERRVLDLERSSREGAKQHRYYSDAISRMEKRLSASLASQARRQENVASNEHAQQETLAQELDQFFNQRLQVLARSRLFFTDAGKYPERERLPRLLGAICTLLFQGASIDLHSLRALLNVPEQGSAHEKIRSIVDSATEFRQKSESSGLSCRWNFEVTPGSKINRDKQEVWTPCDDGYPVKFLVTPAYEVEGQTFLLQRVYTG